MIINKEKKFCYRITHRENLEHILENGLVNKSHVNANRSFISIGNLEIIDVRSLTIVNLEDYGNIGDYVPFYFTPKSIMLLNIITGYYAPKVPKRDKGEIIVIRCLIEKLANQPKWFFTNGQANDGESKHFNKLNELDQIDWDCINQSNFNKNDGDYDRQRRYQAEFLVKDIVPIDCIESICVYDEETKTWVQTLLNAKRKNINLHIIKSYFFD